ncbi:MAG: type II CAAX prenyl endopeptidase Rce1 family protein [Candidatus Hodarchaeota archaeon]
MNEETRINNSLNKKRWIYCPSCGTKLPEIERQKYCMKCGLDLELIKLKRITESSTILRSERMTYKKKIQDKISDEEILNLGEKKLWNSLASIGIPLAAFILMNLIAFVTIIFFMFFVVNLEDLINIILSPYFVIVSSFIELIFILVPVIYIGKYLQSSKLSNRLALLGFSSRGYNNLGILKEVLLGLGFAISAIFLVFFVSLFMELLLELIFGIDIVSSAGGSLNEIDVIIANSDILAIILLILTMVIIIGPSEEILFRGFMQKGLVKNIGKIWGIIITAVLFSFIHLIGIFVMAYDTLIEYVVSFLLNFFPYFAISLLLGLLFYWRKENLIAVTITHGFYNSITIILAYLYFSYV